MLLRRLIIPLLLLCSAAQCAAQMPIRLKTTTEQPPDSIDSVRHDKKHFWRTAGEIVGFNGLLWTYDRYIRKGEFARISLHSVKENFHHGFKWDNDNLPTNTFLHPYNGSLYFNAARANGYNFWQSELFAIGGSAMWEMFMEKEYPSTNDIIATPIGGAAIGEVLFRASDVVLKDCSTGAERVGREIAAFLISPLRGLNRIVTGEAWKWRPTTGRVFGIPNVAIQLSAGFKMLHFNSRSSSMKLGATFQIDLEYGDRFEDYSDRPYDFFTMRADLSILKSQPLLTQLSLTGRLLGREVVNSRKNQLNVGLYQHFDFFDSDTISKVTKRVPYKLGIPACVGVGAMWRNTSASNWTFDAYTHFNAIILGSTLSDHYRVNNRNYNFASGFGTKEGINAVFSRDRLSISLSHSFYRLFTWLGYRSGLDMETHNPGTLNVQGDKSVASFNIIEARANVKLRERLYASFVFDYYRRSTIYRDYRNVKSTSLAARIMLTYKL